MLPRAVITVTIRIDPEAVLNILGTIGQNMFMALDGYNALGQRTVTLALAAVLDMQRHSIDEF